jgi:hypothetical protein
MERVSDRLTGQGRPSRRRHRSRRHAAWVELDRARAAHRQPGPALAAVVEGYVGIAAGWSSTGIELTGAADIEQPARGYHREYVAEWVELLRAGRTELDQPTARVRTGRVGRHRLTGCLTGSAARSRLGRMTGPAESVRGAMPHLTLGRTDQLRIQVGYRRHQGDAAYEHFLLDLPVAVDAAPDLSDDEVLAALEPVLLAGTAAPRPYSLHQHRWHTSWGSAGGVVDFGLLVTVGARSRGLAEATRAATTQAFRALTELARIQPPASAGRDAAVLRARRSVASTFALDADSLSVSAEEHRADTGSWHLQLRVPAGEQYEVVVGFLDGYAGSVHVRHRRPVEVSDSVGTS